MKPSPQASVLFLCCDQAEFAREGIRSILAQEGIVLEILVSDDASRDESYRILEREVAAYDGPHTVVLERNSPRVGHENVFRLALKATCEFQIQAHADDVAHPDRCLKLWQAHLRTGASVVTSHYDHLDVWGNSSSASAVGESRFHSAEQLFEKPHLAGVSGACLSWHREIITRFPSITMDYLSSHRDCLCAIRGALLSGTYFLSESLFKYRHHPWQNSVTTRSDLPFRDKTQEQLKMTLRETVLRDLEWGLEHETDAHKQESFRTLYEQLSSRFLVLSRQQYREIGLLRSKSIAMAFVPIKQLSPPSVRLMKSIPLGRIRRLFFLPREVKRRVASFISSRRAK